MVEFYLLTFPRFPLRKKEHKSYFGKNRTHDFRTSRCAGYLLDHSRYSNIFFFFFFLYVTLALEWCFQMCSSSAGFVGSFCNPYISRQFLPYSYRDNYRDHPKPQILRSPEFPVGSWPSQKAGAGANQSSLPGSKSSRFREASAVRE